MLLTILNLIFLTFYTSSISCYPFGTSNVRCDIFCKGPIIEKLQSVGLYKDSKQIVDMYMKRSPKDIKKAFKELKTYDHKSLKNFLNENFGPSSDTIIPITPSDYREIPQKLLSRISKNKYKYFALKIHQLWKELSVSYVADATTHNERYSILLPKNNFIIIPGKRFKELYYSDTYWIIKGLLRSNMINSAMLLVDNLLDYVKRFGFVPNASRKYYLNRSQPPLLALMVKLVYNKDINKLNENFDILIKEYQYWMEEGKHAVKRTYHTEDGDKEYILNRYYANVTHPRSEEIIKDEKLAENHKNPAEIYSDIVATTESGWDFSSRWTEDFSGDLNKIYTRNILPVELNAYLVEVERTLYKFSKKLRKKRWEIYFKQAYRKRIEAMYHVFYSKEHKFWVDFDLIRNQKRETSKIYLSNFIPLWTKAYHTEGNASIDLNEVIQKLKETFGKNKYEGGMPASTFNSGQQWDSPDAWSACQHMIVMGLRKINSTLSNELALDIAKNWVEANLIAYNKSGYIHEKLKANSKGSVGNGGEYKSETGFGMTNGVLLDFLWIYGRNL